MAFDMLKASLLKKRIKSEIEYIKNNPDGNYHLLTDPEYGGKILGYRKSETIEYFYKIYSDFDKSMKMPIELYDLLKEYFREGSYKRLGIHRTGKGISNLDDRRCLESDMLKSIFTLGIINQGDISRGIVTSSLVPPSKTVAIMSDMFHAVMRIKTDYKGNVGVLVEFPKNMVDEKGNIIAGHESDIYDFSKGVNPVIKPEFLIGFVINDGSKCLFHSKREIIGENKSRVK